MNDYDHALQLMDGENPDIFKVRLLLEKAASQGDDRAEYALATWYLHGEHVEANLPKGVRLLERAAEQGNAEATFDLAVCYERGIGVGRSDKKAFALYLDSAERGDTDAMREVGRMFFHGIGVAEDREAADHWLAKAESHVDESDKLTV